HDALPILKCSVIVLDSLSCINSTNLCVSASIAINVKIFFTDRNSSKQRFSGKYAHLLGILVFLYRILLTVLAEMPMILAIDDRVNDSLAIEKILFLICLVIVWFLINRSL